MIQGLLLRRGWLAALSLALLVDNVRGTPVRAAAVAAAALWGAAVLSRAARRPQASPFFPLLFLWSAAGLFFSVHLSNSLNELSLLAGAGFLYWGAAVLFRERPEEKLFFARALAVLALAKGALTLIPVPGGRLLVDLNGVGVANVSFVPMFMVLSLLAARGLEGNPARWTRLVLAGLALWVCVRWNAASAFLGLAAGLPLESAFRRRRPAYLVGAAAAMALALGVLFSGAGPRWLRYNPGDSSRLERLAIWSDSLSLAADHPVFGVGLGAFEQHYPEYKSLPGTRTANFAHNEWLQLLCETGLPGFVLGILLLSCLLKSLRREAADSPGAAAGLVVLGLWSCLYFVFRSDSLIFTGALFAAFFAGPASAPVTAGFRRGAWALAALLSLAVLPPAVAQVQERRGGGSWDKGDYARALELFRSAARWNPLEPRFLDEQAECLRALDRKPESLPILERAVALKPRDVWLRRKLAVAQLNLVGPEAARRTYAPILDLAPNVERFQREYRELGAPPKG